MLRPDAAGGLLVVNEGKTEGSGDRSKRKRLVGYDGFASILIRARTNRAAIFTISGLLNGVDGI